MGRYSRRGQRGHYSYSPYIPIAERLDMAAREMERLKTQGHEIKPVKVTGRTIGKSFWGKAWAQHIKLFSDYSNRLPRGRTYVRNGSVCHLDIKPEKITGIIVGSANLYQVEMQVQALSKEKWSAIKKHCSGKISSIVDLLSGKFPDDVMKIICDGNQGLFPLIHEIEYNCNCPDWAKVCKHVAAVFYGIATRLDSDPEQLFQLRNVNFNELFDVEKSIDKLTMAKSDTKRIQDEEVANIFGFDMENE